MPLRDIELVIPDENQMKIVIQFLILVLKSVDGLRNSANEQINTMMAIQSQGESNQRWLFETKDFELNNLYRLNMQILSEKTWKKFMLLKVRMKISYSAFAKDLTISELFLKAIEDAYYKRKNEKLLRNPWPKVDMNMIKVILGV